MFSKSIILASTLVALSPAQAAPLLSSPNALHGLNGLNGLNGLTGVASAAAHGDLAVFANAWLAASTGGAYQTCDALTGQLGLNVNLGLNLGTSLITKLNSWAVGQCWNSYHDKSLCGEISAYLTATFYAYQKGWTAIEFLAALGVDRVTHWQDTIGSVCGTPGCPAGTCDILHGQWNGWYTTYTSVDVSAYAAEALELNKLGVFALIDASISAHASVQTNTNVHRGLPIIAAGADAAAHLVGQVKTPLEHVDTAIVGDAFAGAIVHRGLPVVAANANADAYLAAKVVTPIVKADAFADAHVAGSAIVHRGLPVVAAGANADAYLAAAAHTPIVNANTVAAAHVAGSAVVHRGLPVIAANTNANAHVVGHVDTPIFNADGAIVGHAAGSAIIHRGLPVVAAHGSADVYAAGSVDAGSIKANTAAFAHGQGSAIIARDLTAFAQGAGEATVGKLAHAAGEGFIFANKDGIIGAGSGGAVVGPAKVVGAGSAVVY